MPQPISGHGWQTTCATGLVKIASRYGPYHDDTVTQCATCKMQPPVTQPHIDSVTMMVSDFTCSALLSLELSVAIEEGLAGQLTKASY